jgi:hypothetical protein
MTRPAATAQNPEQTTTVAGADYGLFQAGS